MNQLAGRSDNIYPLHRYAGSIEGDRKAGRVPETSIGSGSTNNRIAANSPSKITDRDCPISFFPRQIYAWPLVAAIESRVTERFIGEMWHRLRDR